jgi:hypothetical protein
MYFAGWLSWLPYWNRHRVFYRSTVHIGKYLEPFRPTQPLDCSAQFLIEADRAEVEAWSIRMEGYGGPAQPSPQCLSGGYGWLQVMCHRCSTEASIPLDAIRRPRDTPIWKLEAALKCRSCRTPRYSPRVHMVKLTMRA